jgi:hypothetical protein
MKNLLDRNNFRIVTLQRGAALAVCLLSALAASASGISEPSTTFYGKVLGTADLQPNLITEGHLTWVLRRADGVEVTLTSTLFRYNNGQFSYRLDVPHAALSLGQVVSAGNVPLAMTEQTHQHLRVTLDGEPVTLLGPAGSSFTSAQILRSATYRLDLGVNRRAQDTDGDGIPDWWEDLYGLDKQADDADQVFGSGTLTAAQAYALGIDPTADHTVPRLLNPEKIVYVGGKTALLLDVADLDSSPTQLVYTVTGLPVAGTLWLRGNAGAADVPLEIGAAFTQADVQQARLVYEHDASANDPGQIAFTLGDGQHPPVATATRLLAFEPALEGPVAETAEEALRRDLYEYARAGLVVAQGDIVEASQATAAYALVGVELAGGAGNDIVIAKPGAPSLTLLGHAGADRFVLSSFTNASVELPDFSIAEGDILDLSAFLPVAGGYLSDAVTVQQNTLVFSTGLTVSLPSLAPAEMDLYALVAAGALVTDLQLKPRVSVVATVPLAYRNGPISGVLTVTRQGDMAQDLGINILLTGTAVNGTDYGYIQTPVLLPAGVRTMDLLITPYPYQADVKVARLDILSGSGYRVDASAQYASVTIQPLKPELYVEAILPLAVKEADEPGYFLVWRDGVTASSLVFQMALGGTAVKNVDYAISPNPSVQSFVANETEKLISVSVLSGAVLEAGPKSVTLTTTPSSRYRVSSAYASATVALIERYDTYPDWLARQLGGVSPLYAPAPGPDSDTLFKRYAFGSDLAGTDLSGFPSPFFTADGSFIMRVRQRIGLLDVSYGIRGFTDLAAPLSSAVSLIPVPAPEGQPDGLEWRYYKLNGAGPQGFITVDLE